MIGNLAKIKNLRAWEKVSYIKSKSYTSLGKDIF